MIKTERITHKSILPGIIVMLYLVSCNPKERPIGITEGMREVPDTHVVMDIELPVSELEAGLNQSLSKELINGAIQLNGRKDSLFLRVVRTRSISLAFREGQLYLAAPIKVFAVIKKKVLGLVISNNEQPVIFTATARMSSDLELDKQWDLKFDCRWEGLLWESPPVFDFMGVRLDLTEMLDREIEKTKVILESRICQAFNENMNLREKVENAYQKLHSPMTLLKKVSPVNLFFDIEDLSASLGKYKSDTVLLRIAAKSRIRITSDSVENKKSKLPVRQEISEHQTGMQAYVEAKFSYEYLNQLALLQIVGQSFDYESITAEIEKVRFFNDHRFLAFEVTVGGSQQATIICRGIPDFDENFNFHLAHFSYSLVDGDNLMIVSDATLHNAFEGYLEDLFILNISDQLDTLERMIFQGIEQTPFGSKMDLNLSIREINLHDSGITDQHIQFIFGVNGEAHILLEDQLFVN